MTTHLSSEIGTFRPTGHQAAWLKNRLTTAARHFGAIVWFADGLGGDGDTSYAQCLTSGQAPVMLGEADAILDHRQSRGNGRNRDPFVIGLSHCDQVLAAPAHRSILDRIIRDGDRLGVYLIAVFGVDVPDHWPWPRQRLLESSFS